MLIIETIYGKVQGYNENGVKIFKKILYAEPPIDEIKFAPFAAKKPWEGVLDATQYGSVAYQEYTELIDFLSKIGPENEEYLNLMPGLL
ncbi:hypothetical protein LCGC14_0818460 [marine sediment metagenome]|uniref:Carboxylesterase type B domain-containing protein n=1 Tax=marine sediment metagenome TaxID=412755 RepID=A0A0F9PP78_9ZZZZ